jgi:hypothetical protein
MYVCVLSIELYYNAKQTDKQKFSGSGVCLRVFIKRRLRRFGESGNTRCINRTKKEHIHLYATSATRTGSFKGRYLLLLSI